MRAQPFGGLFFSFFFFLQADELFLSFYRLAGLGFKGFAEWTLQDPDKCALAVHPVFFFLIASPFTCQSPLPALCPPPFHLTPVTAAVLIKRLCT